MGDIIPSRSLASMNEADHMDSTKSVAIVTDSVSQVPEEIVRQQEITVIPVAVITNGSLLYEKVYRKSS